MKQFFDRHSVRHRLLLGFLVIILLLGTVSFMAVRNSYTTRENVDTVMKNYVGVSTIMEHLSRVEQEVQSAISAQSSDTFLQYYRAYNDLERLIGEMEVTVTPSLRDLYYKDTKMMLEALLVSSEQAVQAKRSGSVKEYTIAMNRTIKIGDYVRATLNRLLVEELRIGNENYNGFSNQIAFTNILLMVTLVLALVIAIVITIYFTYKMIHPLEILSSKAVAFSKGNFNEPPLKLSTNDEIQDLSDAFNEMMSQTSKYIQELTDKAAMEQTIKVQEIENLKMKSTLRETELKMLQSQINPHFLFNTLNAAVQLSMIEGAERSADFINNVAELFRYSLRRLDNPVSLSDEVRNVETYMHILQTRFGEKISYKADIDESLLYVKVPCTILQPIVENAYIHGLEDLERNGLITLSISCREAYIDITISDDGLGMSQTQVSQMNDKKVNTHHVSGIGFTNVIERIRLFYNYQSSDDFYHVRSRKDHGTEIRISIPLEVTE